MASATNLRPARRALLAAPAVRVLAPLLVVAAWLWPVAPAYACVCRTRVPVEVEIEEAEVAFAGEVVAGDGRGPYVVDVERVIKGPVGARAEVFASPTREVSAVTTSYDSCGVDVQRGPILYIGAADGRFNLCSPTRLGAAATAALEELFPGQQPPEPTGVATDPVDPAGAADPGEPDGGVPPEAVVLLGAGVAAGAGYAFWRRRGSDHPGEP